VRNEEAGSLPPSDGHCLEGGREGGRALFGWGRCLEMAGVIIISL